jgi:hypothetical protein
VLILRFAAIRAAPSHANFGIKSKAKLANILMLVRFLGLGSADRVAGELQMRASPIGAREYRGWSSPRVVAVGHGVGTGYDHRFGRIATARGAYIAVPHQLRLAIGDESSGC